MYPLLFIFRNHRLYMSLVAFSCSLASASTVLLLFLCFILTTSAIAMVMLQGVYTSGSLYENNQYFDFSTTFLTLLVYTTDGDNYVEAASIGFRDSLWYAFFFLVCSVIGMFFITSLLIDAFCGSYEDDQKSVFVLRKQNERRSLCAAMLCWSRHSYHAAGVYGATRNVTSDNSKYQKYTEEGLEVDAFVDLIVTSAFNEWHGTGWADKLRMTAEGLVNLLEDSEPITQDSLSYSMANLLLNLLAEMSLEELYNQLSAIIPGPTDTLPARCEALLMSLPRVFGVPHCGFTLQQVSWARGYAPEDDKLEEALECLPSLVGLDPEHCRVRMGAHGLL